MVDTNYIVRVVCDEKEYDEVLFNLTLPEIVSNGVVVTPDVVDEFLSLVKGGLNNLSSIVLPFWTFIAKIGGKYHFAI